MNAALCGLGVAFVSGARRVLPGNRRSETKRLADELDQIDATLTDLHSKKRPPGEVLSSAPKRLHSDR